MERRADWVQSKVASVLGEGEEGKGDGESEGGEGGLIYEASQRLGCQAAKEQTYIDCDPWHKHEHR